MLYIYSFPLKLFKSVDNLKCQKNSYISAYIRQIEYAKPPFSLRMLTITKIYLSYTLRQILCHNTVGLNVNPPCTVSVIKYVVDINQVIRFNLNSQFRGRHP